MDYREEDRVESRLRSPSAVRRPRYSDSHDRVEDATRLAARLPSGLHLSAPTLPSGPFSKPMIIPVTLSLGPSTGKSALPPALAQISTSELALIELQGLLEIEGDKRGQTVGKLTIEEDGKGKPTLLIGYHLLEGKVVNLSKPLAVLHRTAPSPAGGDAMDLDSDLHAPPSYEIRAIVRKKLVFSKRPMPMVGMGAASAKPASSVGGK